MCSGHSQLQGQPGPVHQHGRELLLLVLRHGGGAGGVHWLVRAQRHESPGHQVHGGQVQELHVPGEPDVMVMRLCEWVASSFGVVVTSCCCKVFKFCC